METLRYIYYNFDLDKNFSHYKILRSLGTGGMGKVYLAQDTKLDRTVALKILPAEVSENPERMRRFVQEAKTASALKHPNVASIYELGEEHGVHFIAMEHVEGQTLDARISGLPLTCNEILDIAIQVADALDEAHARGIIHRDIKSSNIMLTSRGQVKVLDFGLAKVLQDPQAPGFSQLTTSEGTMAGVILGTVPFMSPEQALGKSLDRRSDIFSIGVVLYHITTGRLPFHGKTSTETIAQITQSQPEPIARLNYNVPQQLETIIRKCLEKDPGRRYQSAGELLIDLKNLKRDTESGSISQPPAQRPRKEHWRSVAILLPLAALITILSYFFYGRMFLRPIDSIAVLPFDNTSHDPNMDYLSDGITENIIYRLSQISSLKVMARSTVFRYKAKDVDPQKAGKELNVSTVLTGTVKRIGDSLVVGTELVNVRDGSQLWGEQYNKKVEDLLPLQQEISQEISERLRLKLTGEQEKLLIKQDTRDPEAFQLYLKGLFYLNKRNDVAIRKGIEYFKQAIDKDPNYSMAYAGLADSYTLMPIFSLVESKDVVPLGKAAALKALEIDETNAEAHASLGSAHQIDWNFSEAEKEYKRAITLNPNSATAHHFYSELLIILGRKQEAIAEIQRAQDLDPLSSIINNSLANTYRRAGYIDRAIQQNQKTLELDPNFARAHYILAHAYMDKGMLQDAIREYELYISKADYGKAYLGDLACMYAKAGRKAETYKLLDEMKKLRKIQYIPAVQFASAYAGLGENDEAFRWLDEAVRNREAPLLNIEYRPWFSSLHSDPRYGEILRRIGLRE